MSNEWNNYENEEEIGEQDYAFQTLNRYGRPKTLEEVGKVFDITRERIRQIEAKALRKLRHPSRSRHLRNYID